MNNTYKKPLKLTHEEQFGYTVGTDLYTRFVYTDLSVNNIRNYNDWIGVNFLDGYVFDSYKWERYPLETVFHVKLGAISHS